MKRNLAVAVVAAVGRLFAGDTEAPASREIYQDAVVAIVQDTVITASDVERETAPYIDQLRARFRDPEELEKQVLELRLAKARELVDRELIYAEFLRQDYTVPDVALQQRLDRVIQQQSGGDRQAFEEYLRQRGMSLGEAEDEARKALAVEMLTDEMVRRRVHVTPSAALRYYRENPEEFTRAGELRLSLMLLRRDGKYASALAATTAKVADQLENREFAAVAAEFSELPNAADGGDLGWMTDADVKQEFRQAAAELEIGQTAGPIELDEGTAFLLLADRREGGTVPFDDELRRRITGRLRRELEDKRLRKFVGDLREKFFVQTFF